MEGYGVEKRLRDRARRELETGEVRAAGNVKERPYYGEQAMTGAVGGLESDMAMQGAACSSENYGRTLIELRRDQLRRQADDLQRLLDALPAKLPEDAGQALLRLVG